MQLAGQSRILPGASRSPHSRRRQRRPGPTAEPQHRLYVNPSSGFACPEQASDATADVCARQPAAEPPPSGAFDWPSAAIGAASAGGDVRGHVGSPMRLLLALAAATAVALPASASAQAAPSVSTTPCPKLQPEARCGHVEVPLDRSRPDGADDPDRVRRAAAHEAGRARAGADLRRVRRPGRRGEREHQTRSP